MLSSYHVIGTSAYEKVTVVLSSQYASKSPRAIALGTCDAVFVTALFSDHTYSHGQMVSAGLLFRFLRELTELSCAAELLIN
jgi:hypothetical protein